MTGPSSGLLSWAPIWPDSEGLVQNLTTQFVKNFKKYDVSDAIVAAGPQL